jgi:hypothetical protein
MGALEKKGTYRLPERERERERERAKQLTMAHRKG